MERFEEALEHLDERVKITERGYSTQYDKLCEMCRNIDLIEQELGITLEVLFKALKEGFWCKVQEDIEKFDACEIVFRFDVKKLLVWICCDYLSFRLEDYGKTWWLEEPKEELENAKD